MPTRILSIGRGLGSPLKHLMVDPAEGYIRYTALSYCWDGDQPFKTTMSVHEEYYRRIPAAGLDGFKTIYDAIDVTWALDLEYLWIDSLCITQDDPQDVATEIDKMCSIFEEAHMTISVAYSRSCREGFLDNATLLYEKALFKLDWT